MGKTMGYLGRICRIGSRALLVLVIGCSALFPSLAWDNQAVGTMSGEDNGETINMFFFLENRTDTEVKVRVLADDTELFVEELEAPSPPPSEEEGPIELPPPPPYPTLEIKALIDTAAEQLEVQELLHSGTRAREAVFDITDFAQQEGGFRITIREDGILLNQDYYPIRLPVQTGPDKVGW